MTERWISDEANLKHWCQKCHNVYDMPHRRANASKTNRGKKAARDLFETPCTHKETNDE